MQLQFTLLKCGRRNGWLFLFLLFSPFAISATNVLNETCLFASHPTYQSNQTENITSNWFEFLAVSNLTTLKLSDNNNPYHLFIIYTDDEIIRKGSIFNEGRDFQLVTTPGKTYFVLQIDDDEEDALIYLDIEPGQIKRLPKNTKGASPKNEVSQELLVQDISQRVLNGPDCDQATTLCNSTTISYNPSGSGENDFTGGNSDGCLNGEHLSAWYYFEFSFDTPPNSSIEFTINPDSGDDYDFAVWGPDVACGDLGSPTRCSYSANGLTGLMDGSGDNTEGAGGNGFVEDIEVSAGDGFYLLIDNFSTNFTGFSLDWSGSAAPYLDCSAIPPEGECAMSANATGNGNDMICSGQIVVVNGQAINGFGELNYSWLATPASAQPYIESPNSQMSIISFPPDAVGEFTFTFSATQTSDGCVATSNVIYTVVPGEQPDLQSFDDICDTDDPISLNQFQDDVFGNWSGENVGGNNFNPEGLSGTIPLIFTPNPGQCSAVDTAYINVGSSVPIALDEIPETCETAESFELSPVQSGQTGTWSGDGVEDNMFNPDGLNGTVTLTFTPDLSCGEPANTSVIINEAVEPNLDDFQPMCQEDASFVLPTEQDGIEGTWSIDGSEETEFDPQLYPGEDVLLTFIPNPDECAVEAETTIEVNVAEEPFLDTIDPLCDGDDPINLNDIQDGVSGSWSGVGVQDNIFNPNGQSDNVILTFTPDASECALEAETTVFVTVGEAPTLDTFDPICDSDATISLATTQDGVNGTWSGDGVEDNMFNPDEQSGDVTLTFTPDDGQCALAETTTITVSMSTTPQLQSFDPICQGDESITLPTSQDGMEGTWSGDGVEDNIFNPELQSNDVVLTFTPTNEPCASEATTIIMVEELVTPNLDAINPQCESNAPVSLSTTQDGVEGSWSGMGVFDNEFRPVGLSGTIELTFTPNSSLCATINTINVEVGTEPVAEFSSTNVNTCHETAEGSIVNLAELIISGNQNGTWVDTDGSGVDLSDASSVDFDGVTAPATYTFTYTIASADGICPDESYTVDVLVEDCSCPSVATNTPPNLCNSDAILDLSTLEDTEEEGSWMIVSTPTGANPATLTGDIFDATQRDAGTYEVTFVLTQVPVQGCPGSSNQMIIVDDAAAPNLDSFNPICDQEDALVLPTTQDGVMGTWSGNGVSAGNTFDPSDLSDTIELTFTPNAGLCASIATTNIVVNTAQIPVLDDLGTICESSNPILLSTNQDGVVGNWMGTGVSANQFNPSNLTGDIELEFIPEDGSCALSNTTIITVTDVFAPNLDPLPDFCQSDSIYSLATMQDGLMGVWSGQGVENDNQFNPANLEGMIELTFTPTNSDCAIPNMTSTNVTAIAIPTLDALANLCETASAISLPNQQDGMNGTWSGQGVSPNGDSFDPTGLTGTIDLTFTPDASFCATQNTTSIQLDSEPFATLSTDNLMTCSTAEEGSIVDLSALIIDGDTNGSWADTDGSGVDVSNPSNVDFENVPDGTYTFTYTTDANVTCPDTSYTISISVDPCLIDCPDVTTSPPLAPICNMDGSLDLSSLVDTEETGSWEITNSPSGNSPAILVGTMFNATDADAGEYSVTYTIVDTIDTCPESSTQIITVEAQPFAVLSENSTNTCNASIDGSILNLSSFIIDGDTNGTWTDDDGTGVDLSDASSVDFDGVAPDQFYNFTYTTSNSTTSCPAPTYTLEVFVENCACPSVALSTPDPICNSGDVFDLSSSQITSQIGTWSIVSSPNGDNPPSLDGTMLDISNVDAGDYVLEFTLNETPEPPCPASNTITLRVDAAVYAGVANSAMMICNSENTSIDLSNEINDEDLGGQWIETSTIPSQGNAFSTNNGTFNPNGQLAGTYLFTYQLGNTSSACATDETTVSIVVTPTPEADAGINQQLTCIDSVLTLNGSNSTGDRFEWTDENGNVIGTTSSIEVSQAGNYTLIAYSDAGCEDTDIVTIQPEASQVIIEAEAIAPDCEETTGAIAIVNASGGTMPYTYGLNGEVIGGISELSNLDPGTYVVQLIDNIGCQTQTSVTIPEPITIEADLGDNQDVRWGDSTEITLVTNAELGPNSSISWSNPELLACPDSCLTTMVTPLETTTIYVTVTDEMGCTTDAEVTLFVDQRPQIYPPTGFTPDDDGFNDYFMIYTGPSVKSFDSFLILNRWGELVFENYELSINQETEGWNGTFKGDNVNPEVFVWVAEFTLIDGSTILRKGDITVVR